jgi:ABC-2 type transport system ATP-binding protein
MTDVRFVGVGKRFGAVEAVRDLTFDVPAGRVTAFLGPNGAGKTTTLRMLLGLIRPSAGSALIDGRPYAALTSPRRVVGAVLEATGFHPGRRGRDHLRIAATDLDPSGLGAMRLGPGGLGASGLGPTGTRPAGLKAARAARVDEVLDLVGLSDAGSRRVGGYSLGMRQRLGLATALLGDPQVLILDEPGNGLDPAGMAWLRSLLRDLAAQGRTVLVSSHVLSEVAQTVDHVVIVSGGEMRFDGSLDDLPDSLESAFLRLTEATGEAAADFAPGGAS